MIIAMNDMLMTASQNELLRDARLKTPVDPPASVVSETSRNTTYATYRRIEPTQDTVVGTTHCENSFVTR